MSKFATLSLICRDRNVSWDGMGHVACYGHVNCDLTVVVVVAGEV